MVSMSILNDELLSPLTMYSCSAFRASILEIRMRSSIGTRGSNWVVSMCEGVSGIVLVVPIAMPSKTIIGGLSWHVEHLKFVV